MNFNTSKYLAEFLEYRNSFSNAKKAYDYYIEACVRREKEIKNLQEENARFREEIVEHLKEIKSLRLILQSHGEIVDMNYDLREQLKDLKQSKGSCFHCEEVALMNVKLEEENARLREALEFYANTKNWKDNDLLGYNSTMFNDDEMVFENGNDWCSGGKLARETIKARKALERSEG